MSYQAIICKIHTRQHPNADRLKIGNVLSGETVVVGLDTQDGELGIYFPSDGQLSEEYAKANDLIRRKDLVTGKAAGGFLEENRRVRNLTLRGVRTDGLWMPIASLLTLSHKPLNLVEGDCLDNIHGVPICNKYESPATRRAQQNRQSQKTKNKESILTRFFPEQDSIPQFRHMLNNIPDSSLIYYTEKLHGMNGRVGLVKKKETWIAMWCRKLGFPLRDRYALVAGSHHVNRGIVTGKPDEEKSNLWTRIAKKFFIDKLEKGECVYFEVVGYDHEKYIMSSQVIGDKEVQKQYGTVMNFRYGCVPGEYRIYIYRIQQANEDGYFVELSWNQVKQRCVELGIPHMPALLFFPYVYVKSASDTFARLADDFSQGPSLLDASHIREGVVLRIESSLGTRWAKHKSWLFKNLEQTAKDDPTYIDLESVE